MSGLKQKEQEIGLVELDGGSQPQAEQPAAEKKDTEKYRHVWLTLAGVVAASLLFMLLGTWLCRVRLAAVCAVIVIDAFIARVLNETELRVHIAVMLLELAIGVFFGRTLFLMFAAAYYISMVVALRLFDLE